MRQPRRRLLHLHPTCQVGRLVITVTWPPMARLLLRVNAWEAPPQPAPLHMPPLPPF